MEPLDQEETWEEEEEDEKKKIVEEVGQGEDLDGSLLFMGLRRSNPLLFFVWLED